MLAQPHSITFKMGLISMMVLMHAHKSSEFKTSSLKEGLYLVTSITKDIEKSARK